MENKSMQTKEKTTTLVAGNTSIQSSLDAFVETPPTASLKPSENLSAAIDQSIVLIDSTANGLHVLMRGLFRDGPDLSARLLDPEKVRTAVFCGKQINDLMRTKIEALQLYTTAESD